MEVIKDLVRDFHFLRESFDIDEFSERAPPIDVVCTGHSVRAPPGSFTCPFVRRSGCSSVIGEFDLSDSVVDTPALFNVSLGSLAGFLE